MTVVILKKRQRGTQSDGRSFTQDHIKAVWDKACQEMTAHPLLHRACKTFSKGFQEKTHVLDNYGHVLYQDAYGQQGPQGWEIDHIHPVDAKETYPNGSHAIDELENLRVLYWESNLRKGIKDARVYELEYEHIILKKSA